MDTLLILGFAAGTLTSLAALPQLIKSLKTKRTKDLSLGMFSVLTVGLILWILYALFTKDVPLVLANIVTLIITVSILFLKIKYK